jgi:hypothetical protein
MVSALEDEPDSDRAPEKQGGAELLPIGVSLSK